MNNKLKHNITRSTMKHFPIPNLNPNSLPKINSNTTPIQNTYLTSLNPSNGTRIYTRT